MGTAARAALPIGLRVKTNASSRASALRYALQARTGAVITGFGKDGRIDLHQDLGRDPERQSVGLSSPGIVYQRPVYIVGGRGVRRSAGFPRRYSRLQMCRPAQLRWSFHTIPHPGEFGYDTWPKDAWTYSGAANNWAGMALDAKRGIVYVPPVRRRPISTAPIGAATICLPTALLALDAETGKRLWHFQAVKHDIWDRDFPSPPTLVTVRRDGKRIDAVAQTTKQGCVYRVRPRDRQAAVSDRVPDVSGQHSGRRSRRRRRSRCRPSRRRLRGSCSPRTC